MFQYGEYLKKCLQKYFIILCSFAPLVPLGWHQLFVSELNECHGQ